MKPATRIMLVFVVVCSLLMIVQAASADVINFDDQGLSGPSTFAAAGPAQTLNINGVVFQGGVILKNTTNLPANTTSLYGTAYFGTETLNPLVITFPSNISNFFLDVYNGLTTNIDYKVFDNLGNQAAFNLPPNLDGGTTQIGFAAAGNVISIQSITAPTEVWDFFIDNIHFNEDLPPNIGVRVPEPGTLLFLGLGLLGLGSLRRRFRK